MYCGFFIQPHFPNKEAVRGVVFYLILEICLDSNKKGTVLCNNIFATYYSNHSCTIIRILLRSLSHGSCSSDWGKNTCLTEIQVAETATRNDQSGLHYVCFNVHTLPSRQFKQSQIFYITIWPLNF